MNHYQIHKKEQKMKISIMGVIKREISFKTYKLFIALILLERIESENKKDITLS